jgi:hypothetical protein
MYASHVSPRIPRTCFLRAVHVRDNLSQAINSIERTLLLLRKMAPDTIPLRLSDPLVRHPVSLPTQATSVYRVHKHQHTIGTFNTCSRGPTHRSLTDTSRRYNLGGADLPHTTPRSFQPIILHFSPKGPARSQVINEIITI